MKKITDLKEGELLTLESAAVLRKTPPCLQAGFVYIIQDSASKRLKIGTSRYPKKRIAHLQKTCPNELTLLHLLPGGRELETDMHRALVDFRLHGEWFEPNESVFSYITRKTTI